MTTQEKIDDLVKKRDNARTTEQKRNLQIIIDNQKAFLKNETKGLNKPHKKQNIMAQKSVIELKLQLLVETKESNAFRLRRNEASTSKEKLAWQTLIDLSEESKSKIKKEIESYYKNGLKAPATKGLRTLCAKTIGVAGLRKKDGTQKKGFVAKKGGKLVKKVVKKTVKK